MLKAEQQAIPITFSLKNAQAVAGQRGPLAQTVSPQALPSSVGSGMTTTQLGQLPELCTHSLSVNSQTKDTVCFFPLGV